MTGGFSQRAGLTATDTRFRIQSILKSHRKPFLFIETLDTQYLFSACEGPRAYAPVDDNLAKVIQFRNPDYL